MSFKSGQRVRLIRNLQMTKIKVPKGTEGVVTSVRTQTKVRFDGIEQVFAIADNDLVKSEDRPADSIPRAFARSTSLGFQVGQIVSLSEPQQMDDGIIPVGSLGEVRDVKSLSKLYLVKFNDYNNAIWVIEGHLEAT